MRDGEKRSFSFSTWEASVEGSAVSPSNTSVATGRPSSSQSRAMIIWSLPRLPSLEYPRLASGHLVPSKYTEVTSHSTREPSSRCPDASRLSMRGWRSSVQSMAS